MFGHQHLEVVNSCKYLGLVFPTKLSFEVATSGEHLTLAKHGTFETLTMLRKLGCFSPVKLIDAQIVPFLLYGSELWGFKAHESIEKVHLQACKLLLNVPSHTPNDMVHGGLGRFSQYIQGEARCLQNWSACVNSLHVAILDRVTLRYMDCNKETAKIKHGLSMLSIFFYFYFFMFQRIRIRMDVRRSW